MIRHDLADHGNEAKIQYDNNPKDYEKDENIFHYVIIKGNFSFIKHSG